MNTQHTVHSRPSANGFGRRRVEREVGTRMENKSQSGKSNSSSRITNNTGEIFFFVVVVVVWIVMNFSFLTNRRY